MKKKISKIMGIGVAVVLIVSLFGFAIPATADPYAPLEPKPNIWTGYPPTPGILGGWFFDPNITRIGPMAQAINGDLYAYVEDASPPARAAGDIFKSTNGGRTWFPSMFPVPCTQASAGRYNGGRVVDMVCSDVYEDVLYVTDGNYVYKSVDGGVTFSFIAPADLEYNLMGKCGVAITGFPITSIDVGYDGGGEPIIFIGTQRIPGRNYVAPHPDVGLPVVGSVYWIADEVFPSEWHDLQLRCYSCCDITVAAGGCYDVFAVGCAPDFATSNKIYAVVTTPDDNCGVAGVTPSTRVVSSIGTTCSWNFVSELCWDCVDDAAHSFEIIHASRIVFPAYYGTNPTLFVGVVGDTVGGDVYRVADTIPPSPIALDLNVQGFSSGCIGVNHANICSLDISNDSLMAGAWDEYQFQNPTNVYYSYDGGWTWAASKKDPTGRGRTYVLWVGNSALAATRYCDCAVSISCGANVGEFWNQISLLNIDIDDVLDLSHAPGYLDGSSTMYALTADDDSCERPAAQPNTSLFRWDGTYCERVYSGWSHNALTDTWTTLLMEWVEVSPDFNTTGCVYMANSGFFMLRTLDTGCTWAPLTYPCEPRPHITAWIVVDLETVLASGDQASGRYIYRTTYHGSQPWEMFPIQDATGAPACDGVDFDLSPNIANDSSVLLGTKCERGPGQAFISMDLGATWHQIVDALGQVFDTNADTYVVFDPGYGTTDDPGEEMVYAACGDDIWRCDIDFTALWIKQDWVVISLPGTIASASGIDAAGDTALYVADRGSAGGPTPLTVSGTIALDYPCGFPGGCTCDIGVGPDAVTESSGHFIDGEPVVIITYNLECDSPDDIEGEIVIMGLVSNAIGMIDIDETLPGACPNCFDHAAFGVISSVLTVSGGIGAVGPIPSGVVRSLNPMDPVPPAFPLHLVVFERLVNAPTMPGPATLEHPPVSSFPKYPDDLWLTAGSNVLWALDSGNPTTIWVWDDPLAAPVIQVAPADGATLVTPYGVTLEWEALDLASLYEVNIYSYCPACPDQKNLEYTITTIETCLVVGAPNYPLLPGTQYFWKVRVALGSPFLSKWSYLRTFTTALGAIPNLCSPECGGDDIIPTTNFSWDEVLGATGYELQIVAAGADGTADFTGAATLTSSVNALASIPGLEYSTSYYWRVRAVMDGVPGAWSVCIFTIMPEPEEPTPPVEVVIPPAEEITPLWIWVIIGIGAALVIAVIVLIVSTRRVS